MLEALEVRRLLSITLLSNGTVQILGTAKGDTITARPHVENGQEFVLFSDNGKTRAIPVNDVKAINVVGGRGNDLVDLEVNFIPTTIVGGQGNDSLFGSTGNDSISGGSGKDLVRAREGHDTVDGGQGNDSLSAGPGN